MEGAGPVSDTLHIISILGTTGWLLYLMPSFMIRLGRDYGWDIPPSMRTLRAELKPFALGFVLAADLPGIATEPSFWNYLFFAIALGCWWLYRHDKDDDDRWKRRGQKLADKVAEVGGRLQVVPAGAS